MQALARKARHVRDDPVLRRWLLRRLVRLEKPPPDFVAGQPPYLGPPGLDPPGLDPPGLEASGALSPEMPGELKSADFPDGSFAPPESPASIALPGEMVELSPADPGLLFTRHYDDLETQLAAHRFAWVPVAGTAVDGSWVAALWQSWTARYGKDNSGWPWHAYTAAERAINIIDFSRRFGLPGDRVEICVSLARHAEIIRNSLEYFGDHYTSNHLSNNGRGLLRIGTAIGRPDYAETGARILVAEAGRIFGRSGVLREGSTHYHQLITRNYIDAWVDARAAGLDQTAMLRDIAERALAVLPGLYLPGGMPLIGDISPDVPPGYLTGLAGGAGENIWPAILSDDRQQEVLALIRTTDAVSPDKLAEDGWHRFGGYGWQALSYVPSDGWPPMPGHGHRDLGGFELHDGGVPIIVDPGRGSYADSDYEDAAMHNGVLIDGAGASPTNRAYYAPAFRDRVIRTRPNLQRTRDGSVLHGAGFQHLAGIDAAEREWRFSETGVSITDRIAGRGRRRIRRQFCTPHPVAPDGDTAIINTGPASYRLSTGGAISLIEMRCWLAYGKGTPGTLIVTETTEMLPTDAVATLERI
jgi:hypothetical protein